MPDPAPLPEWVPLPLRCKACDHQWQDWQPSNCRVPVWVATIKSLHCPSCGRGPKGLFMVTSDA